MVPHLSIRVPILVVCQYLRRKPSRLAETYFQYSRFIYATFSKICLRIRIVRLCRTVDLHLFQKLVGGVHYIQIIVHKAEETFVSVMGLPSRSWHSRLEFYGFTHGVY